MKKLIFCLFILAIVGSTVANAQSPAIWSFYHQIDRKNTDVKFTIPGLLVKSSAIFIKDKATKRFVSRIGKIRLITTEQALDVVSNEKTRHFVSNCHNDGFEDYISIRDESSNVHILVREKRNKIKGLLFLIKDDNDFVLLSARCNLRAKDLSRLMQYYTNNNVVEKVKKQNRTTSKI